MQDFEGDKLMVSFYLSTDFLDNLDDFLFYARKRLPIDKRRKLTKSFFYEAALRLAVKDHNERDEESTLWKTIQEMMQE